MKKFRIYDTQFAHGVALGSGDLNLPPDEYLWTRENDATHRDICFVTESAFHLVPNIKEKHKIGLIIEPRSVSNDPYGMVMNPQFYKNFDYIFTHSQSLIDIAPHRFVFYPFMGCWILPEDRAVHAKSKNLSMIASDKQMTTGHKLRHEVIARHKSKLQGLFGRGHNTIPYKLQALKDYRFQIVIENEKSPHWFTEKLIDCFVTGTIPIYWGAPTIGDFYNQEGIMSFSAIHELDEILERCTEDEYNRRLPALMDNFERAKKHKSLPDNFLQSWVKEKYNL